MKSIIEYFLLWDTYVVFSTAYYILLSGVFFLVWFFKLPFDNFVSEYYLCAKLQACFWCGYGLMFIHYGMMYNNVHERGVWLLHLMAVAATIFYIAIMLVPVINKIRDSIPDRRTH